MNEDQNKLMLSQYASLTLIPLNSQVPAGVVMAASTLQWTLGEEMTTW